MRQAKIDHQSCMQLQRFSTVYSAEHFVLFILFEQTAGEPSFAWK